MDARFFRGRFCDDTDIIVALYALVARNPQQGDFTGVGLESGEKCENASYNWVGGVRVCNSVDRREGVSDDYDGGELRKWSRSSAVKTEAELRSLKLYIALSTEYATLTRL